MTSDIPIISLVVMAAISLAVALFVDTTAWWIRSLSTHTNVGLFVSKSNIYLYGGRFFSLVFVVLLSFLIENGFDSTRVSLVLTLTFFMCALLQLLTAMPGFRNGKILRLLVNLFKLPFHKTIIYSKHTITYPLFFSTAFASLVFGLGNGIPLLLAAIFPEYRLSLSNVGQIINSVGNLAVLFLVDQKLFAAIDNKDISNEIYSYTYGRLIGLSVACLVYFIVFIII